MDAAEEYQRPWMLCSGWSSTDDSGYEAGTTNLAGFVCDFFVHPHTHHRNPPRKAGYETDADESELSEWESGNVRQGQGAYGEYCKLVWKQLELKSIVHFKCVNFHTRDDKLQLTRHKRKLEALVRGPWLLQDLLDFYV